MALAREGCQVGMFARGREAVEAAAAAVRDATGTPTLAIPAYVTAPEDLERLVTTTVRHFGGIDILVANQGGPPCGQALALSDAEW